MKRVLLVCPEPLAHRQPAGVGIRFIEFARQLLAAGHAVELLTPDAAAVAGCTSGAITPESINEASRRCNVAVVQGHVANEVFAHSVGIPTVVDLYDPFIIENLHYSTTSSDEVFQHDHATLTRSLARGDFFLCASDAQRLFYLGLLLASGRVNPERFAADRTLTSLIDIAPFGVPPARSHRRSRNRRVLFGGIYDWYTPELAVEAVALVRRDFPDVSVTFNRHPNAALTPQSKAAAVERLVKERGYGGFVEFASWTPYEERIAYYESFALSLLTFPPSLETDLSMRTRIYDYLWAGLPVVTSSARGTDEILKRYEAGIIVDSLTPAPYAEAIAQLFREEPRLETMSLNAQRFVTDNQWSDVLAPLLRFCADPRIDATKPAERRNDEVAALARPRTILTRIRRRLGRLR